MKPRNTLRRFRVSPEQLTGFKPEQSTKEPKDSNSHKKLWRSNFNLEGESQPQKERLDQRLFIKTSMSNGREFSDYKDQRSLKINFDLSDFIDFLFLSTQVKRACSIIFNSKTSYNFLLPPSSYNYIRCREFAIDSIAWELVFTICTSVPSSPTLQLPTFNTASIQLEPNSPKSHIKTHLSPNTPDLLSNITRLQLWDQFWLLFGLAAPQLQKISDNIYIMNDIFNLNHNSKYHISLFKMEKNSLPDPRYSQFTEELNEEGKVIGFSIPNCNFIFKYDRNGGWFDQDGRYYNSEGVLQSDEQEDVDNLESDDEDLSENDDELIDQFEDMLRKEEEGYVRKETKQVKKVEEQPRPSPQPKNDKGLDLRDFEDLLSKYLKNQHLKENLPGELFIYFKQKAKYFETIKPEVEGKQSVDQKNKQIEIILKAVNQKRSSLVAADKWLSEPQVFLDFSGESQVEGEYERYWYGHIRAKADKYLQFLKQIKQSQVFYLLENKTYYALKSKFYHKKSEQNIKKTIKQFTEKIEGLNDKQTIVIRLDNLPQFFPLSTVYDLVQFVNGNPAEIQDAVIIDEYAAELAVLKSTALKILNLQAYNHDKGQYLEVSLKETKDKTVEDTQKRFYSVSIQGALKLHQRQLHDTLALAYSRSQVAKHCPLQLQSKSKIRFVLGSYPALRKVLMFRGQGLNALHINSQLPS